ncbi:protein tyrosine phosphatase [Caballeronia catudaia]|uniref:protein-tyrosine-phosphatase n=1 Tax=Caballeronia catudaia TaxID=1777136 RepID=A0A158CA90_9BURK|nr:low molecular weight protein-tyrosine-phosphatase [Caballeronia catudaia]SAK79283.1 protein tyrosine phosphatase [Caballeronia catudaia]
MITFTRILVVCTGNICRSPMGAALLKRECGFIDISSAGLHALNGRSADPLAVEVMAEQGIDIESHVARSLTREAAVSADLILVVEAAQKREIEWRIPEAKGRVFRFLERRAIDVPDPFRKSKAHFSAALDLMAEGTADWIARLNAPAVLRK